MPRSCDWYLKFSCFQVIIMKLPLSIFRWNVHKTYDFSLLGPLTAIIKINLYFILFFRNLSVLKHLMASTNSVWAAVPTSSTKSSTCYSVNSPNSSPYVMSSNYKAPRSRGVANQTTIKATAPPRRITRTTSGCCAGSSRNSSTTRRKKWLIFGP